MKKISVKTVSCDKHLIEGATTLITTFETPIKFMDFLEEAQLWKSDNDFIKLLSNEVLKPWITGGPDVIENIVNGLKAIHCYVNQKEYFNQVASLIQSLGKHIANDMYVQSYMNWYLKGISALINIGYCIADYEEEEDNPKIDFPPVCFN